MGHPGINMTSFCEVGFEELEAGGDVKEQILDGDRCARGSSTGTAIDHLAPLDAQEDTNLLFCHTGD